MIRYGVIRYGLALIGAGWLVAGCGGSHDQAARAPLASSAGPAVTAGGQQGTAAGPQGTAAPVEVSPQGDISDQVAYVLWTSADGRVRFTHPEGWSQTTMAGGVRFGSKLDSVTVTVASGPPPTKDLVNAQLVATLQASGTAVQIESVTDASVPAGPAVEVKWQVNSAADPVTSKVHRDEVVTYVVGGPGGQVARMDLVSPVGSDNVDPNRIMSQSLRLS